MRRMARAFLWWQLPLSPFYRLRMTVSGKLRVSSDTLRVSFDRLRMTAAGMLLPSGLRGRWWQSCYLTIGRNVYICHPTVKSH